MENKGITYMKALKKAQMLGIAETNPTLDVEGFDTASKLLIFINVLMDEDKLLEDIGFVDSTLCLKFNNEHINCRRR